MIRYIEKGDIFRIEGATSYAHGCNSAGAFTGTYGEYTTTRTF